MSNKISDHIQNALSQMSDGMNQHILNRYHTLFYATALGVSAFIGSAFAFSSTAHAQTIYVQISAAQNAVQDQVSLSSEVFVIRTENDAQGNEKIILKNPKDVIVIPGDRLKFILKYTNNTGQDVTGFKATNPIPAAVQYIEAAEEWAEVSVDGGKNWGKLEDLSVQANNDTGDTNVLRAATVADVTHVRWVFNNVITKNSSGSVSFNGIVK